MINMHRILVHRIGGFFSVCLMHIGRDCWSFCVAFAMQTSCATASFSKLFKSLRLTNLRRVKIRTMCEPHIKLHTTLEYAYHHALHTMWFILYVYSISGFCFSFWSSHSVRMEKETWLTHVCLYAVYTLPASWINTRTSAVFIVKSFWLWHLLCILK